MGLLPAKTLCTYQDIFYSFKDHIGVVNSKKTVQNPLNSRGTFFAGWLYFFGFDQFLPYEFFALKHHIGSGQHQKSRGKSAKP